jgi:basic membrane lipoprotein Med (substrate-binding protein (PBP1-ABC) superfamily)
VVKKLLRRPWQVWTAGAVAVVAVGTIAWLVVRSGSEPVRERQYRAETACLLTGEGGVRGAKAAPIWTGMQRASVESLVKVSFVVVNGPQTAGNAGTYLAGLVQSRCDLLLAVDAAPVGAVAASASAFPQQKFVVVGGPAAANVSALEGTSDAAYRLVMDSFE